MNARDILFYGNRDVLNTFKKVPENAWDIQRVCGTWSAKDVLSHLTSYELVLQEIIDSLHDKSIHTPYINSIKISFPEFNKEQVAARSSKTSKQILVEYTKANTVIMEGIAKLSPKLFLKVGIAPWYGKEYCLDDLIVYLNYGHKKEHLAQVSVFIDSLLV